MEAKSGGMKQQLGGKVWNSRRERPMGPILMRPIVLSSSASHPPFLLPVFQKVESVSALPWTRRDEEHSIHHSGHGQVIVSFHKNQHRKKSASDRQ